ncbi:Fibronectin/fibrinogen-binding protein [Minicystis rosea]|nr:Fibronectin/fibrinogen-binding protein [Minicystis rosea]
MTTFLGATVQRVDVGPEVVLIRARAPGATSFVIVASGRRGGVGVAAEKPWKGAGLPGGVAPDGEKMRYRARLEGGRIEALGARSIVIQKGESRFVIEAAMSDGSRIVLREAAAAEAFDTDARDEDALLAEGERLGRELGEGAFAARRQEVTRALAKARARVTRRIEAVRGDLARIGEADDLAARAALFVAEAARAPRGATKIAVTDWSTGEPVPIELALDPARSAREQVDAMFKRARRLKLGAAIAEKRLAETEATAARLEAVAGDLDAVTTPAEIEALVTALRSAAPRDFALAQARAGDGKGTAKTAPSRPFRTFAGSGGARIFVGRGAAHNDALTFHTARPHDLWLHAKARAGAHVIVPLDKNQVCPSDVLVDAAHLAAHFSEAREEAIVEVQHTPRRYLRKPKGSAPGFVIVDREKVLVLRVERDRLAGLLAAEEP